MVRPKSKLALLFSVLGLATLTQCGVKGSPVSDRQQAGPLDVYDPAKKPQKP